MLVHVHVVLVAGDAESRENLNLRVGSAVDCSVENSRQTVL